MRRAAAQILLGTALLTLVAALSRDREALELEQEGPVRVEDALEAAPSPTALLEGTNAGEDTSSPAAGRREAARQMGAEAPQRDLAAGMRQRVGATQPGEPRAGAVLPRSVERESERWLRGDERAQPEDLLRCDD